MVELQLWMFPILAGAVFYAMHLVVMWRLKESEKRWARDHAARQQAE
ncbi:MAG: hypothetical protein JNJ73_01270 [Hyphomonadaceae bacterium]|nr:hypothetical protein [Hyphomonadaceae bacterium]